MVKYLEGGWAEEETCAICLLPKRVSGALGCSLGNCDVFHREVGALTVGQGPQGSADMPPAQAQ